ncbi:hypothetical protein JCM10908_003806 [Rhodotorula pacifica]|uniref:uncharacterized protein n=1 Tax=Rhodotorula pacifica TaxID=1495444 RepID=UPI003174D428
MTSDQRFVGLSDEEAPSPPLASSSSPTSEAGESTTANTLANESDRNYDQDSASEPDTWWTPSELRDLLSRAKELKNVGNAEFGQGRWEMAIESYREGLAELPETRSQSGPVSVKGKEKELQPDHEQEATERDAVSVEDRAEWEECRELRAMLSANVAACYLKLERWKEAIAACDEALESKPEYIKAIHRRATANEALGTWSSLQSALDDWNTLGTLSDTPPSLSAQIKAAQRRLPDQIKLQQEKEKDEVLGKLKDLGNMVLGKFGLSTDNFKLQEQPGGGYGLSFQQ